MAMFQDDKIITLKSKSSEQPFKKNIFLYLIKKTIIIIILVYKM